MEIRKSTLFKEGNKAGVGRPRGSKSKAQLFLEKIGTDRGEEVLNKVVAQALEGDIQSQKLILERVYPVPKHQRYISQSSICAIETKEDLDKVSKETFDLIRSGELSLEEGLTLTTLIEKRAIVVLQLQNEKLREELAEYEENRIG
jgi:hypothetical protein